MIARQPVRSVILSPIGQSNENGFCQTFDGLTRVPFQCLVGTGADPMQPEGTDRGSKWPFLIDHFAINDNIALTVRNTAIGATSIVVDWCGDNAGVPIAMGQPGFDPNSYLSNALDEVSGGVYSSRWVTVDFGQTDATLSTSAANYQLAMENVANYFLANGIKVILGLSVVMNGQVTWYEDNGLVGLNGALATFSGNANVIKGTDLYTAFGKDPSTSFLQTDGTHMIDTGYINAGQLLYDAIKGSL